MSPVSKLACQWWAYEINWTGQFFHDFQWLSTREKRRTALSTLSG